MMVAPPVKVLLPVVGASLMVPAPALVTPKAPDTMPVREPVPLLDPRMEFWDMVTVPEMVPPSRRSEPKLPAVSTQPVLFRVKLLASVTAEET